MKKLVIIALVLISFVASAAVHTELKFMQIGISKGLSHATVSAIGQSSDGYIWIATPDGLNRYDGYSFGVFRHDSENPNTLRDNAIKNIAFDVDGIMWVSGSDYLSRYDKSAEIFQNYPIDSNYVITSILPIDADRILVGTKTGLQTFTPSTGEYHRGFAGKEFNKQVASLSRQADKVFISAAKDGLTSLDLSDGTLTELHLDGNPYVAHTLPDGNSLLVATEGHGLFRIDAKTGRIIARYRKGGPEGLGSDYVRSMAHDNQGRVWVGTFNGLDILDVERKHFTHFGRRPWI